MTEHKFPSLDVAAIANTHDALRLCAGCRRLGVGQP